MTDYLNTKVVCAAIKHKVTGRIIAGARHYDDLMQNAIDYSTDCESWKESYNIEQGFIDQKGRFLTRKEAFVVAELHGQIVYRCGSEHNKILYSENLY